MIDLSKESDGPFLFLFLIWGSAMVIIQLASILFMGTIAISKGIPDQEMQTVFAFLDLLEFVDVVAVAYFALALIRLIIKTQRGDKK